MPDEIQLQTPDHPRLDYVEPAILHELTLEVRAGSPLIIDPLADPLGLDPVAGD